MSEPYIIFHITFHGTFLPAVDIREDKNSKKRSNNLITFNVIKGFLDNTLGIDLL